jgi:hypothetical protein
MKLSITWFSAVIISTLALMLPPAAPAQAQSTRTFVSATGDDNNPCSRTSPCQTFSGAIAKTATNGEINCLDTGSFGQVSNILKSITIDCHEIFASISYPGTYGLQINFSGFAGNDVRKTVRLRNINFNGLDTGATGINIVDGANAPGSTVIIEDCLIDGNFLAQSRGIEDSRAHGGKLIVTNTTIRNLGGAAVSVLPGGSSNIQVLLNNVRAYNGGTGAQFGNLTRVMIDQSTFTGNVGAGILAVSSAIVNVNRSVMSHNGNGVQASGGGTIVLSNSDIAFNTSQGVNISGGTVNSFGNNRISSNASPGTLPTLLGSTSNPTGQN